MIQLSPELRAALDATANQPVDLYELHLDSQTLYFSDQTISWGGNNYLPYVLSRSAIRRYDGGQFDQVQVTFSNVDTAIAQVLLGNGIEGRRLIIRKVDRSVANDSLVLFNGVMERPSDIDEESATVTAVQLLGSLDHEVPARRFTTFCPWQFKSFECGYAGAESECNKSWARCSELANTDRYGGFRFVPHSGTFQYQEVERKRFLLLFSRKKTVTKTATFNAVDDTPYEVPIPIVLGRAQIAGVPIQYVDEGGETKILAALAVGTCSNITYIRANGHLVASATGHLGQIGGTGSQLVDPRFPQGYPYNLLCYVGVTVPSDVREEDPAPVIDCVLLGALVDFYNTAGQWTGFGWSDNPVWVTIWFLRLSLAQGGMGFPESWIDFAACAETAAYCDELIPDTTNDQKMYAPPTLPGSMELGVDYQRFQSTGVDGQDPLEDGPYATYEVGVDDDTDVAPAPVPVKRFTMNGVIGRAEKAVDVLFKKLLPSFRGYITFSKEGKLQIRAERPVTNTTLSAPAAASATEISVEDISGFQAGDLVLVGALTEAAEVRTVSQVQPGVLHLAVPLGEAHAAGEQVHFVHLAFDDSNIIGKISYPLSDRQASTNRVTVKYVDAPAGFEAREVWVNDYEHQAQVRRVNNEEVDGSMIDSYFQAWRIGQWARAKARDLGRFVSIRADISASALEIGDIITVSSGEHGLRNVPFRVIEVSFEPDDEVAITGQLYALGVYDDSAPQAIVTVPGVFRPILPTSPSETGPPHAPTNPTLQIIDAGDEYVALLLWSKPVTQGGTSGYQIELQFAADDQGNEIVADWGFGNQAMGYAAEKYQYQSAGKAPVTRWARGRIAGFNPLGELSSYAYTDWEQIGPSSGAGIHAPAQPDGSGWSVALGPTQADAQTGQQFQRIDVTITARPSGVEYFHVWVYEGASAPTDRSVWEPPYAKHMTASGDTVIEFWRPRDSTARTYQIAVTGNTSVMTVFPTPGVTPVKPVTVPAIAAATLPGTWDITANSQEIAGTLYGAYAITANLPADNNRDYWITQRRFTSPSWAEPKSEWFPFLSGLTLPYSQNAEWKWPADEWIEIRFGIVNFAGQIAWHGTIVQLHLSGGGLIKASALDPSTLGPGINKVGTQIVATVANAGLSNGNFDADLSDWTTSGNVVVETALAYNGKAARLNANGQWQYIGQRIPATPGTSYRLEGYARTNIASGPRYLVIQWLDENLGFVFPTASTGDVAGDSYNRYSAAGIAPPTARWVQVGAAVADTVGSGYLIVDGLTLTIVEPVVPGGGLARTPVGVEIEPGALGNLAKYTASVRPMPIVNSLPALPDSNYPLNSFAVLSTNGRLYRNIGNVWTGTPAEEIITGTLGASVAYVGTIAAGQVSAGTFQGLKLVLDLNGITARLENALDSSLGEYVGLKVARNSDGLGTVIGAGAVYLYSPSAIPTINIRHNQIALARRDNSQMRAQVLMDSDSGGFFVWSDTNVLRGSLTSAGGVGTLSLFSVGAAGGVFVNSARIIREKKPGSPGTTSWATMTTDLNARYNFNPSTVSLYETAAILKSLLFDLQQHHGLI